MAQVVTVLIWIILLTGCSSQDSKIESLPEERGLILSTLDKERDVYGKIRHVPGYLGYENVSVEIPAIQITSTGRTHILSVDVEFRSKTFYMYDYHLGSILVGSGYNKDLNISGMDVDTLHVGVSKGTVQLAVDWLSHTIYWTDSLFRWVVAAPVEKQKIDKDYYKIIADYHLDAPDGVSVDPMKGYLFWSDNGKHPKIERSDLQGKNRHSIIFKNLRSPLSLKADIFSQRIYWIDSVTESIMSATYEGKDLKLIARIPNSILFDLAIYKDVVYITDIYNDRMYTVNKTTGRAAYSTIGISSETIYNVAVYGEYNQPLKDRDYCGEKKCDNLCISEENGAMCICSEGYEFSTTNQMCQESNSNFHKALVFANTTHICYMDIRSFAYAAYGLVCRYSVISLSNPAPTAANPSSTPMPTASPGDIIKMIDLDIENRDVFFATVDNKIYKRPIDLPIESDAKELIIEAAGTISGMVYDGGNLFWCESNTGTIWVVNVDTKFAERVNTDGSVLLVKPRNIITLPTQRLLAWVAGNKNAVSIQTMTQDGKVLRTIVRGFSDIISLVYNNEAQLFYFISNGTVYESTLKGSTSEITSNFADKTAYLLLHYNNYLAWIYSNPTFGNIWKSKDYNTNTTQGHSILPSSVPFVDMKVLDIKPKLPDAANPCVYMNGGCEQICVPKYTGDIMVKVCECSLGYKLASDDVSCTSDVAMGDFILVTDLTNPSLHQIDLQTNEINTVLNKENAIYMGVFFDSKSKRIIWSEYRTSMIFSSNVDGSDQKVIGNIGNYYPNRMDKDMTTGNLYYTTFTSNNSHIGVLTPSGVNIRLKEDFTVELLGDIVVHPGKGWMFYTVTHVISYIARANMDGSDEVKIIGGGHVAVPDGLAIDFTHDHLYWSDAFYDSIQRCNLDGKQCVTIVNKTGTFKREEIRDLVTDGIYLYYSAYRKDHVVRVNLATPSATTVIGQNPSLGKLDTMALYTTSNTNIQPVSQTCKDNDGLGDCSTICLPTRTGRTCACEADVTLTPDGRTCSNIYQCTAVISTDVQTTKGVEKINVTIDENCRRHLNDKCQYRCPENFTPVNTANTNLTCMNVGWDRETELLCTKLTCEAGGVANGKVVGDCNQRIGDMCMIQCNQGYTNTTNMVSCDGNLQWSPRQPCIETQITVAAAQTSGVPVAGIAGGVVALVVVIIVLVVIILFILHRRRARRQSSARCASAEFHRSQDGTIAIENPGYISSDAPSVHNNDEHPYSTVNPDAGSQPTIGEHEMLPEVAQVEITEPTHDTATLTYDSWLKEVQKRKN